MALAPTCGCLCAGHLSDFFKLFLRVAVALFVAPLAAFITSFTSLANAQPNTPVVSASPSSLFHKGSDVNHVGKSSFARMHVAFPEATGVNTAAIDAVLSKVPLCSTINTKQDDLSHATPTASRSHLISLSAAPTSSAVSESGSKQLNGPTHEWLNLQSLHQTQERLSGSSTAHRHTAFVITDAARPAQPLQTEQLGPAARPSETMQTAGDGRDRVQDMLRALDNRLDNAISGAQGSALRSLPASGAVDAEAAQAARELVQEAVELVEQVCAHSSGHTIRTSTETSSSARA